MYLQGFALSTDSVMYSWVPRLLIGGRFPKPTWQSRLFACAIDEKRLASSDLEAEVVLEESGGFKETGGRAAKWSSESRKLTVGLLRSERSDW